MSCERVLLHTDIFTHKRFYTQTLSHTDVFTHRSFYTQTLLHTEAKRLRLTLQNRNFTTVFGVQTSFRAKELHRTRGVAILLQRLAIAGLRPDARNRNFTSVCGDRTSFRAKEFAGRGLQIAILTYFNSVFAIETRFVRKGCVSCRLVGTAPRAQEKIEKKEDARIKRARGQERKRAREQKGKRARGKRGCEDVRM